MRYNVTELVTLLAVSPVGTWRGHMADRDRPDSVRSTQANSPPQLKMAAGEAGEGNNKLF